MQGVILFKLRKDHTYEFFAKKVATKLLFSIMNLDVSDEVALSIETFPTKIAFKWFFSSVSQNVLLHVGRIGKYLGAKWTTILLFSEFDGRRVILALVKSRI